VQTFASIDCEMDFAGVVQHRKISYLQAEDFGAAIAIWNKREVVKAFGGVLNGLDGTFGPE